MGEMNYLGKVAKGVGGVLKAVEGADCVLVGSATVCMQ